MTFAGPLYLGWQYLWQHRWRSLLVALAVTLGLSLPTGVWLVVGLAETHLRSQALSTPLLLGANGSPLELVFNSLYFSEPNINTLKLREAEDAVADQLAQAIPLYARYQAQGYCIVGTTIDYLNFRQLSFASGQAFTRLGDCIVGSEVANDLGLSPGDTLVSSPRRAFDLAGVYPLKMRVVGVLRPTGTPDDRAVFTDLKTTWVIEGLAHGHEDATQPDDAVLEQDNTNTTLNASVTGYNQITDQNIQSFHFHGDMRDYPITAAILIPQDTRSQTILLGRYVGQGQSLQLIEPVTQIANLFNTAFQVRTLVSLMLLAVALSSFLIVALVLILSNRLRETEFASLRVIGASPAVIRFLVLFETGAILAGAITLTAGTLTALWLLTPPLLAWVI